MSFKYFLDKLFSSKPEVVPTPPIATITFLSEILFGEDLKFQIAKVFDEKVYCCAGDEFLIGSYKLKDTRGEMAVYAVYDAENSQIGEITNTEKSCIAYLVHPQNPYNMKPVATIGASLKDIDNYSTICLTEGNKIAAVAAFICMSYEVHAYTKYHDFYC